jgi:hypothetical protein
VARTLNSKEKNSVRLRYPYNYFNLKFYNFFLVFPDEGRAGRNDLIGAAFKKQCPLHGPQGFSFAIIQIKNQNARQVLLLRLPKIE